MTKPGEKNISALIDPAISEEFKTHCDSVGRRQYKAIEGALRLWLNLPSEIQALVIDSDDRSVQIVSDYLSRRLREALSNALTRIEPPGKSPGEPPSKTD